MARRRRDETKSARSRTARGTTGRIKNDHCDFAHYIEYLHEARVVRPPKSQIGATLDRDRGELGPRLLRVSLPSAGQSHWLVALHAHAAQSDAGMHHHRRVRGHRVGAIPANASLE